MKKILLSIACMACIGACNATTPAVTDGYPENRTVTTTAPESPAMQALQQAQAKWKATLQSGHYIYTLEYTPSFNKPLRIRVKDGEVVQVMTVPDNTSLPPRRSNQVLTVDDLFAAAKTELEGSDKIRVIYDPEYGFPKLITIGGVDGGKYKASGMRLLE